MGIALSNNGIRRDLHGRIGSEDPGTCANRPGAWPLTRSDMPNRTSRISTARRRLVYERDNFTCRYCGKVFPDSRGPRHAPARDDYFDRKGTRRLCMLEVDHIMPVMLGGSNHIDNLQALCTQCNCRKGAKL